jgi:hypothetical protein
MAANFAIAHLTVSKGMPVFLVNCFDVNGCVNADRIFLGLSPSMRGW